jgi:hypothetical protein
LSRNDVHSSARVVWCLKRRATDVRCVLVSDGVPAEIRVVHGPDVIATEVFEAEWMALEWARAYRQRLYAQGWRDVPGVASVAQDT